MRDFENALHYVSKARWKRTYGLTSRVAQDVQLKILQLLPSLLQNYGHLILDALLVIALHVCFLLLASKNAIVSNTAAATLQQVAISVFDRVLQEDKDVSEDGLVQDVPVENGWTSVRRAALDAQRLLNDICLLIDGQAPQFLVATPFHATFGLELIESILANHVAVVVAHPELIQILRTRLLPFIIRTLSEKIGFSITARSLRLLPVILGRMLDALETECEMVLGLINHMLDPDAGASWKRVLCMELLRLLTSDAELTRRIYSRFDKNETKRNIVQDQMAVMVRLASEKPSIIGLGQHSTIPYSSAQSEHDTDQMAALQAEGISGTIGVAVTVKPSTSHGISNKFSNLKVPCLEQLDKTEPPTIPPSYLYSLALVCTNNFADGIAKFLLPFTVSMESRPKRRSQPQESQLSQVNDAAARPLLAKMDREALPRLLANPLDLKSHNQYDQIMICAAMVESCWPALLAAYSTFMHAALDSEYYRGLIRSFQKFTQVAGLLRLSSPRDAFLTTLSKNAIPSGSISFLYAHGSDSSTKAVSTSEPQETDVSSEIMVDRSKRPSQDHRGSLNSRNLLCLRALLNLGIGLGPVLDSAWSIILETLQQADLLIGHISNQRRKMPANPNAREDADYFADISSEISAVSSAATRLFESTSDVTDDSYLAVLSALCGLLRDVDPELLKDAEDSIADSEEGTNAAPFQTFDPRLNLFVIEQIAKITKLNEHRIYMQPTSQNGWKTISQSLQGVIFTSHLSADVRIKAGKALLAMVTMTAAPSVLQGLQDGTRLQGLQELWSIIKGVNHPSEDSKATKSCEEELHVLTLETMRSMLEIYGETLKTGWEQVFAIIISVFEEQPRGEYLYPVQQDQRTTCKSLKLLRVSFASLQLICSDFLSSVPQPCIRDMIIAMRGFVDQQDDLNLALTVSFYGVIDDGI